MNQMFICILIALFVYFLFLFHLVVVTSTSVHEDHGGNESGQNSEFTSSSQDFCVELKFEIASLNRILLLNFGGIVDLNALLEFSQEALSHAAEGFAMFLGFVPCSANFGQIFPSERGPVIPLRHH